MQTHLSWKKGFLSSTYNIFSGNNLVGHLQNNTFSQVSKGQLNNNNYTFRTVGLFDQTTEIIDKENKVIGKITYNNWMTKATINIFDKTLNWKYENIWNTKWRIFDDYGVQINYSGTSMDGKINSNTDDEIFLLSGLFVTNYYWQMSIVIIIAVFIPIYLTALN